jgi:Predicted Fe-S oxidoreductases
MNHNWIGLDQHVKKIKPMGPTSPHVWSFEPVFGCNLACGHCCAKLIKKDKHEYMTEAVWTAAWDILGKVSPTVRVDICGFVGEPTLHPQLTEWLKIARKLAPLAQIQLTTNGTMLLNGKVDYKAMFKAGLNIAYTDQYGSHRKFEELAAASGYPFYQYYDSPQGAPTPWKYYGPTLK